MVQEAIRGQDVAYQDALGSRSPVRSESRSPVRNERSKDQDQDVLEQADMYDVDENAAREKAARRMGRQMLKKNDGVTVWQAARQNNVELLTAFFLVMGSEKLLALHNHEKPEGGRTLLHTACWYGAEESVNYLLKLGADSNAIDTVYNRCTPLIEAARANQPNICHALLAHGARLDHQDAHGDTALHWASRRGWGSLACSLVHLSEEYQPSSTTGVLDVLNLKKSRPVDVAKTSTVVRMLTKLSATKEADQAYGK